MPIRRAMLTTLRQRAKQYPIVTLTGPRQSGKTTLAQTAFPRHHYVNLEDPEQREYARTDPREFLANLSRGAILDEVQRVPELFSWLQVNVDADDRPGRFILTGSHNFLLMKSIRQSLAGRSAVLHLLPLARSELAGGRPVALETLGRRLPRTAEAGAMPEDLFKTLLRGGYPRIHDKNLSPQTWLADYFQTYVERDVPEVLAVSDLEAFGRFVRLCAGRNGQLLNLSSLAGDCGITHPTAKSWLSVLQSSFLVKLLRPYHGNFNKRLVKSPKLYFLDTGLLCYLLRIRTPDELRVHAARGAVFESHVIGELEKNFLNRGLEADLWFWRDARGHEVDVIVETAAGAVPVEIKSGQTIAADFLIGLHHWLALSGDESRASVLVYGGNEGRRQGGTLILPWSAL